MHIHVVKEEDIIDAVRIKVKKAYPAYFDSYHEIDVVRDHLKTIENLYCVGRNGQHRYNNMDHSILTSLTAVRSILNPEAVDKESVWDVNTEKEYHEVKSEDKSQALSKKEKHNKSLFWELVRFVVVGIYGTLIDFAIEGWATSMISSKTEGIGHIPAFFVMFLISILGFLVATPATWSLTSVWGFRNVTKESEAKAKSIKGALLFTFWAFIGLLGGAVIQFIGYMTCLEWSGWNINILGGFNFQQMFGEGGNLAIFYAWAVVLVIRTAFTMVFNYLTRKFLIYKAPKES